jgi:hypothetical protein
MKLSALVLFLLASRVVMAQTILPATKGGADDTEAIQKAINGGPRAIHFASGKYRLTKTVLIDLDKSGFISLVGDGTASIVMEGSGPAFHFIGTHGGTADPTSVKPNVWERQRTPMVDGLEIVGANPEADGIEATGTMQLTITRTTVREARHGIHLTTRNRNVIISDCHLYNNKGIGVFYDNVDLHQSNIIGCHISYNSGGGVVTRGGAVRNLQIGTCDIEANMSPDAPPAANVFIDCSGGSTAEVTIVGCTLQHSPKSPGSANIVFLGKGAERGKTFDAETTQWGHLTIADNVISDTRVNVHVQHARGVTINGNTFGVGHDHHLIVEDCSNIVIGPNSFDRNPRYYYGEAEKANDAIVFRNSHDCTLSGLHIDGVLRQPAAVVIEDCHDFNISNCTILDSDGSGLLLKNVRDSLITGCLIRDRRADRQKAPSILIEGGEGNEFANNKLMHGSETIPAK